MSLSNKEVNALLREAASRENLAAAVKGGKAAKEFRVEREALEKAHGGAKNLAEADKVLADAKVEAGRINAAANARTGNIVNAANDITRKANAEFDVRVQGLDDHEARLREITERQDDKAREISGANAALNERVEAAEELDRTLTARETAVKTRERNATAREAEIKRFDDWRSKIPA